MRREEAGKYIDLVGLNGFEKAYPVQISGGMKQRVGIARAYCTKPDVMLMDEPFGALDAQTRYLMQDEVIRISSTEKRTVVFVTNNVEEAIYLADRIIINQTIYHPAPAARQTFSSDFWPAPFFFPVPSFTPFLCGFIAQSQLGFQVCGCRADTNLGLKIFNFQSYLFLFSIALISLRRLKNSGST